MRQRSADRLTQEDRRRFEEIFLPYLDAAYNLARWIIAVSATHRPQAQRKAAAIFQFPVS